MSTSTDEDVAFIQALAEMVTASDLAEIEVVRGGEGAETLKVRLTRNIAPPPAMAPVVLSHPQTMSVPVPAPGAGATAPTPAPGASGPDMSKAVTSPMVGTVYLAAEPGAAQFVSEGDKVSEGQTILIIEAMKTMNQIPAPRSGRVAAILVNNAEPVEFGEPLIIIE